MTIDKTEAERIAEAVHCLRPEWVASSIVTLIGNSPDLRSRAFRDLATAFAWVAADDESREPGRVKQPGPWWSHTNAQRATVSAISQACPVKGHEQYPAWNCECCAKEAITDPEQVAAHLAELKAIAKRRDRTPTDHSEPIPARAERADRSKA